MTRAIFSDSTRLDQVQTASQVFKCGARVRLRPKAKTDASDMTLVGRTATIESIEQDYENKIHLAVTMEDDPGKDFGLNRYIPYRFFFAPEEVEPI